MEKILSNNISWKQKYLELEEATLEFRAMFTELLSSNDSRDSERYQSFLEATIITEKRLNDLIGTNTKFVNSRVFIDNTL